MMTPLKSFLGPDSAAFAEDTPSELLSLLILESGLTSASSVSLTLIPLHHYSLYQILA